MCLCYTESEVPPIPVRESVMSRKDKSQPKDVAASQAEETMTAVTEGLSAPDVEAVQKVESEKGHAAGYLEALRRHKKNKK